MSVPHAIGVGDEAPHLESSERIIPIQQLHGRPDPGNHAYVHLSRRIGGVARPNAESATSRSDSRVCRHRAPGLRHPCSQMCSEGEYVVVGRTFGYHLPFVCARSNASIWVSIASSSCSRCGSDQSTRRSLAQRRSGGLSGSWASRPRGRCPARAATWS